MSSITKIQLKDILKICCEDIRNQNVLEDIPCLKVVHYIKDIDFYFTLVMGNNDFQIVFEPQSDSDIEIEMDLDIFHNIQLGKINSLIAGLKGDFKLLKGNPMQLLVLQKVPISEAYSSAVLKTVGSID